MFPSPVLGAYCYKKEYRVLVACRPDEKQFAARQHGIMLEEGYKTEPVRMRVTGTYGKDAWMQVILTEGRKRQIREMGCFTGLPVGRIGSLVLSRLKPGQRRSLTEAEGEALKTGAPISKEKSQRNQK